MTMGEQIKEARKKKNIAQMDLAKMLGVNQTMISQWERGTSNPKLTTLHRIAEALEVSIYELLGDNERELFVEGEASALFHGLGKHYSFSHGEQNLISAFSELNEMGQQVAIERVKELAKIPDYQKPSQQKDFPTSPLEEK